MAQNAARFKQRIEQAHRWTGAKLPRTAHTQGNALSGPTGEPEPGGPGRRTRNIKHRAGTPSKRSQVAQNTAHATQQTTLTHR